MAEFYVVKQGDCVSSIADKFGFFWQDIWDQSQNSDIRTQRQNPNVLLPGDRIFIPDKTSREESCQTTLIHTFRMKSIPVYLRFRLLDTESAPRGGVKYTLKVDGQEKTGVSKTDGMIEQVIDPHAKSATLTINDPDGDEEYEFQLGYLDPVDQTDGLQARLKNLGYLQGDITGEIDDATKDAIQQFQKAAGLPMTGEPDQATRDALRGSHEA